MAGEAAAETPPADTAEAGTAVDPEPTEPVAVAGEEPAETTHDDTHPALLVVDEIGYLPVNQDGAVLFFQLINARRERASTVLTLNERFEDWGGVLGDAVMAAALIDRLVHHCHIVNIRGAATR